MKKLLLIEDNAEMRENTAEILTLSNYKVLTAENGKAGIKLAQAEKPDLIICDIMMPELDGYGVLHMLSKDPATAAIPFIFLTAKAEKSDYRKGMGMGADDYLTKPFDDMELLNAVETRLKKSDILKKEYQRSASGLNDFFENVKGIEELGKLSANRKIRQISKKELIYNEGNYPNSVFFISKGKIKVFKTNELGKEFITELLGEGDFMGYSALLEESPYTDSAMALEDSEVVVVPREDFFALLYHNRDVSARFIKMLSNDLREKEERLLKQAYDSVRKRVAGALLLLQERYSKDSSKNFSMAIMREDLAGIVGTATETVIRTLSDFKDEGLIEVRGGTISIVNSEKLSRMKN